MVDSPTKGQHSVPINKDAFKMMAANRTKNSFLDEITADVAIKPIDIVDNVKPYTVQNRRRLTPDIGTPGA